MSTAPPAFILPLSFFWLSWTENLFCQNLCIRKIFRIKSIMLFIALSPTCQITLKSVQKLQHKRETNTFLGFFGDCLFIRDKSIIFCSLFFIEILWQILVKSFECMIIKVHYFSTLHNFKVHKPDRRGHWKESRDSGLRIRGRRRIDKKV